MKSLRAFLSIVTFAVIFPAAVFSQTPAASPSGKFQLQDGDVVVFDFDPDGGGEGFAFELADAQ